MAKWHTEVWRRKASSSTLWRGSSPPQGSWTRSYRITSLSLVLQLKLINLHRAPPGLKPLVGIQHLISLTISMFPISVCQGRRAASQLCQGRGPRGGAGRERQRSGVLQAVVPGGGAREPGPGGALLSQSYRPWLRSRWTAGVQDHWWGAVLSIWTDVTWPFLHYEISDLPTVYLDSPLLFFCHISMMVNPIYLSGSHSNFDLSAKLAELCPTRSIETS